MSLPNDCPANTTPSHEHPPQGAVPRAPWETPKVQRDPIKTHTDKIPYSAELHSVSIVYGPS
jgi:hypothetical protein